METMINKLKYLMGFLLSFIFSFDISFGSFSIDRKNMRAEVYGPSLLQQPDIEPTIFGKIISHIFLPLNIFLFFFISFLIGLIILIRKKRKISK